MVLAFATGLLLGAAGVWLLREREMRFLRAELTQATDRLVHAWKEGAIIPPRPVTVEPPKALPPELQEAVDEWESPEARAAAEANVRSWYFDKGWGVQAILKHLQNHRL